MMTIVLIYMCVFLAVVATVLAAVIKILARPNRCNQDMPDLTAAAIPFRVIWPRTFSTSERSS